MANKIPPVPAGSPPGSAFWNDWYEKLRNLINSGTIAQAWSSIDFAGSNITDIASRNHNNLQGFQGGVAGEYYHTTQAQNTLLGKIASGVYTPTLTNTTNIDTSTTSVAQYMRVNTVVTVSGMVSVDPTAAGIVVLELSLPITSNFANIQECSGVATSADVAGQSAAIMAEITNNRAVMSWTAIDVTDHTMYYTYTYQVI